MGIILVMANQHLCSLFQLLMVKQLVLESPVQSGYWVPSGPNHDQDQLVLSQKLKKTRLDRYKLVRGWLEQLFISYKTGSNWSYWS